MKPPAPTWKHAKREPTCEMNTGLMTTFDVFGSTRCETPFVSVHCVSGRPLLGAKEKSRIPGTILSVHIEGLHHAQICIPTGAEGPAREFYCGVLGLREIEKPDALKPRGGFWLQVGDRQVHVGTEAPFDRTQTKAHLAYAVSDLDGWRRRLAEEGIVAEAGVKIPGYERFEFRDPFGNRVEFITSDPTASS